MKLLNNVTVIDGVWSVEEVVRQVVEESEDDEAFHVIDLGEVVQRYETWKRLMPRVEPFYAVKCNDDPMLVRTLAALGAGFDCATFQELDLVSELGVAPERIIYAHTTKMVSHIRHAARIGVTTITFDSSDELTKIKRIMPCAKLVLRIRCDAKVAHVSLGNKFGCDPVSEAPELLKMALELGMEVIGISFHVGSGAEEPEAYVRGVQHCAALFKTGEALGLKMGLVDIGGGYPGHLQSSIQKTWMNNEKHTMYYMSDGVFGSFMDCVFCDLRPTPVLVTPSKGTPEPSSLWGPTYDGLDCVLPSTLLPPLPLIKPSKGTPEPSSLWGPTCDGLDCVLPSTLLPPLPLGSWLLFRDMGAYTRSLATTFHGFPKAKVKVVVDSKIWLTLKNSKLFADVNIERRSKNGQKLL